MVQLKKSLSLLVVTVAQFISTYPNQLPVGVAVKVSCDALGVSGTLRGKAVL